MIKTGEKLNLRPSEAMDDPGSEGVPKLAEMVADWVPWDALGAGGWPLDQMPAPEPVSPDNPRSGCYVPPCPTIHHTPLYNANEKVITNDDLLRWRIHMRSGPLVFQNALKMITDRYATLGIAMPLMKDLSRMIAYDVQQLMETNSTYQIVRTSLSEANDNLSRIADSESMNFWMRRIAKNGDYLPCTDWSNSAKGDYQLWTWDEDNHDKLLSHAKDAGYSNNVIMVFACQSLASLDDLGSFRNELLKEYHGGMRWIGLRANELNYVAKQTASECIEAPLENTGRRKHD
jgi:hypothetical protein